MNAARAGRARNDWRRRGREAALQILYHWEMGQTEVADAIETFFALQWPSAEPVPDEIRSFAGDLARDTVARIPAIDTAIAETTERWRPERMAVLDRLILRMAMCELIRGGTPAPVVINEALELARTFSTEDSVKFINGMLDGMLKKLPR